MFVNAALISGSAGSVAGTNVDATIEPGEPVGSPTNKTVWYKWTAPTNLSMTFETADAGSLTDTVIGVYMGSAVNALTSIAWNDDMNGPNNRHSRVTFIAVAGNLYYIQVRGYSDLAGTFSLRREINRAETNKQFNFDGNISHASDFGVFRPSNGYWYLWLSGTIPNFRAQPWGVSGDILAPGDYDGDELTDIAVWRPGANGSYYVLQSMTGTLLALQWGSSGDVPVQGDFDGDDHADFAVWRSSNGYFYVRKSSDGTLLAIKWGVNGDFLACGDYDGDGLTDFGVQRGVAGGLGTFYIRTSSDGGLMARQFGLGDDIVMPGDYDGDGKNDVSVYRYSNHYFYTLRSTDGGFNGFAWGIDLDIPLVGDYIGYPESDVCVFRPSSGTFYCLGDGGAGSFYFFHFGQSGDIPVGSSNVH